MKELHTLQNSSSLKPRDPNKVKIALAYRNEINAIIEKYVRSSLAENKKLELSVLEKDVEGVKAEDREALLMQIKDIVLWLNDINCVAYGLRPENVTPFLDLPSSIEAPVP